MTTSRKYSQVKIPETLDEAIAVVVESISDEDIFRIKSGEIKLAQVCQHMAKLLNTAWNLESESALVLDFRRRFRLFGHYTDISNAVMLGAWAQIRNAIIDWDEWRDDVEETWEALGINASTGNHDG